MCTSRIQLLFPSCLTTLQGFCPPPDGRLERIILRRHLSHKVGADDGNFSEDVLPYFWYFVEEEEGEDTGAHTEGAGHDGAARDGQ